MLDERFEELAALHAFGLLEGEELAAFEAELARSAELRALAAELKEAAGSLALSVSASAPPPALKARLLAEIAARQGPPPGENTAKIVAGPFARWLPWAVAIGFAFVSIWMAQLYLGQRAETLASNEDAELAHADAQSAKNQLEAERLLSGRQLADLRQQLQRHDDLTRFKIARLVSLAGNSSQARATVVWDPTRREGLFTIEKLPAQPDDHDYELWVIDAQKSKPVSAGVFAVDAEGDARLEFRPAQPVAAAAKFAVSLEKKGGAPADSGPQGPVIMLSE